MKNLTKQHKWNKYYRGKEELEFNGEWRCMHIYDFPTDALQTEFLDEIGGAPHPLGGRRVVLEK